MAKTGKQASASKSKVVTPYKSCETIAAPVRGSRRR
jgi:hypothetical protein